MQLEELIQHLRHESVAGPVDMPVNVVAPLSVENSRPDLLSWCNEKNIQVLEELTCGVVICPVSARTLVRPQGCTFIFCNDPRSAFREAVELMHPRPAVEEYRSPLAIIASDAQLARRVYVGHHVVIEAGCIIGEGSSIGHGTVLHAGTVVGTDVRIGCNCTIGGVGFGYQPDEQGVQRRMPHLGHVRIDEGVEVGSNTCIDRASMGHTWIQRNVKIDNLVHIAHNVEVGENSMVIANAMIGGSCKLGRNTWIAPGAAIRNKIDIGDDAVIGLGAVVVKHVAPGTTVAGNPARPLPAKE